MTTLLMYVTIIAAQTPVLDSIKVQLAKHPQRDTQRVHIIMSYVRAAVNENTTGLLPLLQEEISISKELNYKSGLQSGYITGQMYYADRSDFSTSFLYADSAFALSKGDTAVKDLVNIAFLHHNVAGDYYKIGAYDIAVDHYNKAAAILEKHNPKSLSGVYNGLAMVYENMLLPQKAREYFEKGIASAEQYGSKTDIAKRNMGYITWFINQKKFDSASAHLKKMEPLVMEINDAYSSFLFYQSRGDIAQSKKQYEQAVSDYKKTYDVAAGADDVYRQVTVLDPLCKALMEAGDLERAKLYIDTLSFFSNKFGFAFGRLNALTNYARWYAKKEDYKTSNSYLMQKALLADSISSNTLKEKIAMMETRFKVESKDNEIKMLQDEKQIQLLSIRQKNTLNYILIGGALALIAILILSYRNYSHRQRLQQQRISELETEKQLTATEAVLKGEEQERTRLAKDLHDGLGGMLSGIKHSFQNMKGNLIMTPDNAQAFERSMDMLDSSIKEMRRVAHNMMPEALVKFGLDAALKDFCNDINLSGTLSVSYQSIGLDKQKINDTVAITVFRIVQELLNNTLKHAAATTAIVQMSLNNDTLSVTVEDDGKGFDISKLSATKGMGWNNIQNRVDLLKGKIDISSSAEGTSVLIELPQ
ncbi:MAG: sensor histidine kinase [Niabella sp.]